MGELDYFRDDHYFDKWHSYSKEEYFLVRGFHYGIMYNGKYTLVFKKEYESTPPDYEFEEVTWYDVIRIAIEEDCLDDILFDIPDLARRVENTTAEDYKNFYKAIKKQE